VRTTLELDRELVNEALKISGERTISSAVNRALLEYVRRRKLEDLRELIGTGQLIDNWRELEELELKETEEQLG
jgi:Arc/MetJ family transcription regulator